jgi:hypothetical protein
MGSFIMRDMVAVFFGAIEKPRTFQYAVLSWSGCALALLCTTEITNTFGSLS